MTSDDRALRYIEGPLGPAAEPPRDAAARRLRRRVPPAPLPSSPRARPARHARPRVPPRPSAAPAAAPRPAHPPPPSTATGRTIKIGYVTPEDRSVRRRSPRPTTTSSTGVKEAIGAGDRQRRHDLSDRDHRQGQPVRPATGGRGRDELILDDAIDLMLVASTPETTNPVADQCEANGVPCISTVAPWQPYFLGRQPGVAPPDDEAVRTGRTTSSGASRTSSRSSSTCGARSTTNKTVGGLLPERRRRQGLERCRGRLPAAARRRPATRIVDPGRYENLSTRTSPSQITAFKDGRRRDPDRRAAAARLHDLLDAGRAAGLQAEGRLDRQGAAVPGVGRGARADLGEGLSSEVWWSPNHPFSSSLTEPVGQGAGRRLHAGDEQAVDPADRLRPCRLRGRRRRADPRRRASTTRPPSATPSRRPRSTRSSATSSGRRRACHRSRDERRQDAARRRPVGEGRRLPVRPRHREQQGPPGYPDDRHDAADPGQLTTADRDGGRPSTPILRAGGRSARRSAASSSPTTSRCALAPGEMLGVVGPNGAGKTSVLNLVTGNLAPDGGRIVLDGTDITRLPAHARARLGIGRTYQIPRPFGGMTVFENVLLGATYAGRDRHGGRDPTDASVDGARGGPGWSTARTSWPASLRAARPEAARAGSGARDPAAAAAARRDRRWAHRGRGRGARRRRSRGLRASGVSDRLDRAHRRGPAVGRRPDDRDGLRPRSWPRASRAAVLADPAVHAVYLGQEASRDPARASSGVSSFYGDFQALFDVSLDGRRGRDGRDHRRQRGRQVDAAPADRRADADPRRRRSATTGSRSTRCRPTTGCSSGISLVPEGRRVFPSLTVDENLLVGAYRRAAGPWDLADGPRPVPDPRRARPVGAPRSCPAASSRRWRSAGR